MQAERFGCRNNRAWAGLFAFLLPGVAALAAGERVPTIKHEPVAAAVRGQPISIRAVVQDDSGLCQVTLFYTPSRDAAPFKTPMQPVGAGSYVGSIPAAVVSGREVFYYIEAVDEEANVAETPWYSIRLETAADASPGEDETKGARPTSKWVKPAFYAGGAAALVGGVAWLLSDSGDSDSGDGWGTTNVGTYAGTATVVLEMPGTAPRSTSRAMSITIVSSGIVSSDTIHPGQHLESRLNGNNFVLIASVNETNLTGQIRYSGTVVDDRIVGGVDGTARNSAGTEGAYSGTFYAARQ